MKKVNKFSSLTALICVALVFSLSVPISAERDTASQKKLLIPGGVPFGVKIYCDGVLVVGLSDVKSLSGSVCPAKDAGILAKDIITEINGSPVKTVNEVADAIGSSEGKTIGIKVIRGDQTFDVTLSPAISKEDGKYKTGLYIKDSTAGIGTVTYIEPDDMTFAGLGHGICDADTGKLIPLSKGLVVNVGIDGVIKGQCGVPGELKGHFCQGKIGTLISNNEYGVYGILTSLPDKLSTVQMEAAKVDEVCEGDAEILCTLDDGGIGKYSIKLSNIQRTKDDIRNFVITVTDKKLLEKTGGIVQGMSGSPIIQNGKLVGAVTHVFINDPAKGYGIFIENMLAESEKIMSE